LKHSPSRHVLVLIRHYLPGSKHGGPVRSVADLIARLVETSRRLRYVPGVFGLAQKASYLLARRTGNTRWKLAAELSRSIEGSWFLRRGLFGVDDLPNLMGEQQFRNLDKLFRPRDFVRRLSGTLPSNLRMALSVIESKSFMKNQLLRDSDWSSMAHSIELRTPLADSWLLRDLEDVLGVFGEYPRKSLLVGAVTQELPLIIRNRRKTGFNIPITKWINQNSSDSDSKHPSRLWAILVREQFA